MCKLFTSIALTFIVAIACALPLQARDKSADIAKKDEASSPRDEAASAEAAGEVEDAQVAGVIAAVDDTEPFISKYLFGQLYRDGARFIYSPCDQPDQSYVVRDAEGAGGLQALVNKRMPKRGFWYAEIIADKASLDGMSGLVVKKVTSLSNDYSCEQVSYALPAT